MGLLSGHVKLAAGLALMSCTPVAAGAPDQAPAGATCATRARCAMVVAKDPARCAALDNQLMRPAGFVAGGQIQLDRYEKIVAEWMDGYQGGSDPERSTVQAPEPGIGRAARSSLS